MDSNIFYYHLLDDKTYGPKATAILRRIEEGEEAATSVIVISELVSLFEYRKLQLNKSGFTEDRKKKLIEAFDAAIKGFHELLASLPQLRKLECSWLDALKAFDYREEFRSGFNDCLNMAIMERNKITEIYSYDKAFDSVPWLNRKQE